MKICSESYKKPLKPEPIYLFGSLVLYIGAKARLHKCHHLGWICGILSLRVGNKVEDIGALYLLMCAPIHFVLQKQISKWDGITL